MSDNDNDFLEEAEWLEKETIGGFRVWHIIAICLGISLSILIMVCCCIRFRIPRTKQEIEADYQRKQIAKKFREKLAQIKNSEMDEMDLQKAIARIQAECFAAQNNDNIENASKEQYANVKFKNTIQVPA